MRTAALLVMASTLAVVIAAWCYSAIWRDSEPRSPTSDFALSAEQLNDNLVRAKKGDLASIKRVGDYYGFYRNDANAQTFWIKRAADLGDDEARYAYAYDLYASADARYSTDSNKVRLERLVEAAHWVALIANKNKFAADLEIQIGERTKQAKQEKYPESK